MGALSYVRMHGLDLYIQHTMRAKLIGHFQPCITEIYLHIDARMADYIRTHPYRYLDHGAAYGSPGDSSLECQRIGPGRQYRLYTLPPVYVSVSILYP